MNYIISKCVAEGKALKEVLLFRSRIFKLFAVMKIPLNTVRLKEQTSDNL